MEVEGAVGCSCAERLEAEREAGGALSFVRLCFPGNSRQTADPFKRGRLSREADLETGHSKSLVYSNFGKRRSLSGQRAFVRVGSHPANRRGERCGISSSLNALVSNKTKRWSSSYVQAETITTKEKIREKLDFGLDIRLRMDIVSLTITNTISNSDCITILYLLSRYS